MKRRYNDLRNMNKEHVKIELLHPDYRDIYNMSDTKHHRIHPQYNPYIPLN